MRFVAGIFGFLFMLGGAVGFYLGFDHLPFEDDSPASYDWRCVAQPDGSQECVVTENRLTSVVVDTAWRDTAFTTGGVLFISGAALCAGAVAASGRKQQVQVVQAPMPQQPRQPMPPQR